MTKCLQCSAIWTVNNAFLNSSSERSKEQFTARILLCPTHSFRHGIFSADDLFSPVLSSIRPWSSLEYIDPTGRIRHARVAELSLAPHRYTHSQRVPRNFIHSRSCYKETRSASLFIIIKIHCSCSSPVIAESDGKRTESELAVGSARTSLARVNNDRLLQRTAIITLSDSPCNHLSGAFALFSSH